MISANFVFWLKVLKFLIIYVLLLYSSSSLISQASPIIDSTSPLTVNVWKNSGLVFLQCVNKTSPGSFGPRIQHYQEENIDIPPFECEGLFLTSFVWSLVCCLRDWGQYSSFFNATPLIYPDSQPYLDYCNRTSVREEAKICLFDPTTTITPMVSTTTPSFTPPSVETSLLNYNSGRIVETLFCILVPCILGFFVGYGINVLSGFFLEM